MIRPAQIHGISRRRAKTRLVGIIFPVVRISRPHQQDRRSAQYGLFGGYYQPSS